MSALPDTEAIVAVNVTSSVAPGVVGKPASLVNVTRQTQVNRWMMSSELSSGAESAVALIDKPATFGANENVGATFGTPTKEAAVMPSCVAVKPSTAT